MHAVARFVRARGGLAPTHELLASGHSRQAIAVAVRGGDVIRARQGWYVSRDIHPLLVEAVRVGGVASCISGLALYGCWVPPGSDLHVAVGSHSSRLRSRQDRRQRLTSVSRPQVVIHWRESLAPTIVLPPLQCLSDVVSCQPPDLASAVADSLLHRMPQLTHDWPDFVAAAPAAHRWWLAAVDGVCESGTETVFWFRMAAHRLPISRQRRIAGIGRVDFLIGDRLIVEVDGAEYHTDREQFEADRHRDALLSARGYRVLRFSFRQVMFAWAEVEAAVLAAVVRGDHR